MFARFLIVLCAALLAAAPASAYDTLEQDFAACTQGQGKISNEDIVAACSRLIDNAQQENETIGFFYAFRATANTDKASNCRDAKKVMELIKDPGLVENAKELVKINC